MNLKKETLEILKENNKSWDDVVAVCGKDFQITKEDFVKYSDTEYDSSFGAAEVAEDLIIVGEGWWLERAEYDGSEWWEYKTFPDYKGLPFKSISALTIWQARMNGHGYVGWKTLARLNEPPERSDAE